MLVSKHAVLLPNSLELIADGIGKATGIAYTCVMLATFLPAVYVLYRRIEHQPDADLKTLSPLEWVTTSLAVIAPAAAGLVKL